MILYPNKMVKKVEDIKIEFLNKYKIKALILDVDNTLIGDKDKVLTNDVIEWAYNLQGQGVKLYILSNSNNIKKIKKVAENLKIENYFYFAKKPMKIGFYKIQKELGIEFENIAVVGDQIFTDIIGGNRCNMFTILVEPINRKEMWITRIKRPFENIIIKKYKKEVTKEE